MVHAKTTKIFLEQITVGADVLKMNANILCYVMSCHVMKSIIHTKKVSIDHTC